jgi:hypothetical protein
VSKRRQPLDVLNNGPVRRRSVQRYENCAVHAVVLSAVSVIHP